MGDGRALARPDRAARRGPAEVAATRFGADRDSLEAAGDDFHQRVAAGYRELAAADPDRWVVVDATGPVEAVAERILAAVTSRLP